MKLNVNFIKMIKSLLISNKLKPIPYARIISFFSKNLIEIKHIALSHKNWSLIPEVTTLEKGVSRAPCNMNKRITQVFLIP